MITLVWVLRGLKQRKPADLRPMSQAHPPGRARRGVVGTVKSRREQVAQPAMEESKNVQGETVTKLRVLSHDLSNYIETIMQASYLLAQAKLDDNNKKWLGLIDKASQDAARVNREIREILRSQN
jgi:hypothetical protein